MTARKIVVSQEKFEKLESGEQNTVTVPQGRGYKVKDLVLIQTNKNLKMGVVVRHKAWYKITSMKPAVDDHVMLTIEKA